MRLPGCSIAVVLALGVTNTASAQTADEMYEKGLQAMLAGDFATGCPAIDQSYQLDPLPGALFTSAVCHARWGMFKSALERYDRFIVAQAQVGVNTLTPAQRAKANERVTSAIAKIDELRPKIPKIIVKLSAPGAGSESATVNGAAAAFDTEIPLDPGDHTVTLTKADGQTEERSETLTAGDVRTVFFDLAPASVVEVDSPPPDDGMSTRDMMLLGAIASGGVGVIGIVVGGVTGGLVFGKKGTVDDNCNDDDICTQEGKDAADSAQTLGLISSIGFGVGIAGLAAGTALFLLAPDEEGGQDVARFNFGAGPNGAFIGVNGSW